MLCDSCELYRFPVLAAAGSKMDVRKSNRTTSRCKSSSGDAGCNAAQAKPQSVPSTGAKRDVSAADLLGRPSVAEVPVVGVPKNKHGSSYKRIVLNELLTYVCFYRDYGNTELLRRVVLGNYALEDFSEAKKILLHKLQSLVSSCPFVADRRNSSGRAAHEAELEDILGILDAAEC